MKQRIVAVVLYTAIFLCICFWFNDNSFSFLADSENKYNLLFVSWALLLIFGFYLTEPFFTKPVDIITNTTAIILALLSVNKPEDFIWYNYLFYSALSLLVASILIISMHQVFPKMEHVQNMFYELVVKIWQSKVSFSVIYLATLFSYFSKNQPIEFTVFFTFWIILITQFLIEDFILWISKLIKFKKQKTDLLWIAIWCENPFLYNIEVDFAKHSTVGIKKWTLVYLSIDQWEWAVWIIINDKQLLNKKWASLYLFEHDRNPIKINLKSNLLITWKDTIFSKDNAVYALDINTLEPSQKHLIEENHLYKNRDNFIWYVTNWSNINKIHFEVLIDITNTNYSLIREWSIVTSKIYDYETLFQIIDWKTAEEELEKHSTYWYLTWIAQKLWRYDRSTNELNPVRWLPSIYAPVFLDKTSSVNQNNLSIWKLPTTNYQIVIKDPNALVTHNTAILGILWIWKSCLTFELIQKILNSTDAKIVCIDITNEYKNKLTEYIPVNLIVSDDETAFNSINSTFWYIHSETWWANNYEKSWNHLIYKNEIKKDLLNFLFNSQTIPANREFDVSKRLRIFNPDYHKASKWEKVGFNVITTELTQAEKTRIITEEIFKILMWLWLWETWKAKVLLVFEEAHSLVPEWSSTANDGDKSAVNWTAKVILQWRKYGLGSLIITQRTANISKSILNQCNTIFALRVFDDTWKQFLENYIWSDYSNALPTLEERHAIVVWKALKLKQPVIIELNNKDTVILSTT